MTKRLLLMCTFLIAFLAVHAQVSQLTGKVSDSKSGQPIIGAAVFNVSNNAGDVTDENGNFNIKASKGNVIQISYLGYKTETITLGDQKNLDINLDTDGVLLEEAVITGAMGIKMNTRNLSHSATQVAGENLFLTGRNDALSSLAGRVPGLSMTPTSGMAGSSVAIQLRGPSSIDGNNQPLIIVDGLPIDNRTFSQGALTTDQPNRTADYTNRAGDLNPNDIESVVVLKGAEAAALYGIDASSGAIIITTKKGKKGSSRITYDNMIKVDKLFRFPEYSTDYLRGFNGIEDFTTANYFGPRITEGAQTFDNVGNFFRNGTSQTHNLSFEGGSENITYRLSSGFTNQKGIVPTNDFRRFNIRLNTTAKISNRIDATGSFTYTNSESNSPLRGSNGYFLTLIQWPTTDDAQVYLNPDGTRRRIRGDFAAEPENPFFNVNRSTNTSNTNRNQGNFSLTYRTTDWLSFTGRIGIDNYSTVGSQFLHPETNEGVGIGGRIETFNDNSLLLNGNFIGTVRKEFGDLKLSFSAGAAVDDRNFEITSQRGEKLYIPDFVSINNTDPITQRNKLTISNHRLIGLLGMLELNYKNYLIFNINGRNDWSSTLPLQNNNFFSPSAGVSFIFSDFDMFKNSVLSFGKLRATVASVGKDARPYLVKSRLVPQTTTGGGFIYDFFGSNPNLTPEATRSIEIGADLKFLKNRIGLDIAYFNTTRFDQIVQQRLSYGTGFIFGLLNGGTFDTKGIELSLDLIPFRNEKFDWAINVNFATFRTTVRNLPADQAEYYNSDTWLYGNARASAFVNRDDIVKYFSTVNLAGAELRGAGSAMSIGGYDYLRNNNGQILINPVSGLPLINTNFLPIGDRTPDFTMGVNNTLTYGAFSLSFLFDIRKGGDVYNGTERFLWLSGLSNKLEDRNIPYTFNGVLRDGRENSDQPTPNTIQISPLTRTEFYSAFPESHFVERDINWIRLRDMTLAYQLPSAILQKTKIVKEASIYFTATELWMLTNYTGADPNVNGNSAATRGAGSAGFDFGSLSLPRSFVGGLRVRF
jgi:TonB-linked SusC/RagA family outer membrane protein